MPNLLVSLFATLRRCLRIFPWLAPHSPMLRLLPPLSAATSCSGSDRGLGGVLFLRWPSGDTIVLKAIGDDIEAVSSFIVQSLCAEGGVLLPDVEVLSLAGHTGHALRLQVRTLTSQRGTVDVPRRLEQQRRTILEANSRVMLMQYVQGGRAFLPSNESPDRANAALAAPGIAQALGRVMACDLVLNNWDRLPSGLPAWQPDPKSAWAAAHPGNLDNLLVASDGTLVAIDTDLKRGYANGGSTSDNDYIAQVGEAFANLRQAVLSRVPSSLAVSLREGLGKLRAGTNLSDTLLLIYDQAMYDTMERLARDPDLVKRTHSAALDSLRHHFANGPSLGHDVAVDLVQRTHRIIEEWRTCIGA